MNNEPFKNPLLRRIPANGMTAPRRFTMKRVPTPPKPSPYVEMELRRKFAVETLRSIKALPAEQMIELELMLQDEGEIDL
jgi:hypothetical protein